VRLLELLRLKETLSRVGNRKRSVAVQRSPCGTASTFVTLCKYPDEFWSEVPRDVTNWIHTICLGALLKAFLSDAFQKKAYEEYFMVMDMTSGHLKNNVLTKYNGKTS